MRQLLALILSLMSGVTIGVLLGYYLTTQVLHPNNDYLSPFVDESQSNSRPLEKYSIPNLTQFEFTPSQVVIKEEIARSDEYVEYVFNYTTHGRNMSGQLTLPVNFALHPTDHPAPTKVIVLVRGWADIKTYTTGSGTRPVARELAKKGFATLAPDFFGYGKSDPAPGNEWETRFLKPVNVIELIKSVEINGVIDGRLDLPQDYFIALPATSNIGLWGHSNGGQVALTTLEALSQPIPTALWAPVTAPFPYSILFFGRDLEDEGKQQRAWIALFEKTYNVLDFSLTQHLDKLTGPIQLHHGSADQDALQVWSDSFATNVELENKNRLTNEDDETTAHPTTTLEPIELIYHQYPGADHNLRPITHWNTALSRDLTFFNKHLK